MSVNEANLMGKLMKKVVEEGTASALNGRGYTAAGKTGSAEFDENGIQSFLVCGLFQCR